MKQIKFMLLAIAMLLAAPAFLTSCQEDAPEINYTINVSVINDFNKVIEAINNGSLPNEEAIKKLTEAIDKMNANQQIKQQAIIDVLNSVNATIETKLAAIEAAIKAQTLTIEAKLELLKAVIKALPDYTAQLEGINDLIEQVKQGNTNAATALAQIIVKLEELKGNICNCNCGGGGTPPSTKEYVDLGLPSGLKWATCNLGASKPSESGDHYAWGDPKPKTLYIDLWENYKFNTDDKLTEYNETDGKTTLDPKDDVATSVLGSPWRMPTKEEFKELIEYCTWTSTSQDGVNGYEVKGRSGKSIFLPDVSPINGTETPWPGAYWSSSLYAEDTGKAYSLTFSYSEGALNSYILDPFGRALGLSVRPVRN